jgi:hypothetical protein
MDSCAYAPPAGSAHCQPSQSSTCGLPAARSCALRGMQRIGWEPRAKNQGKARSSCVSHSVPLASRIARYDSETLKMSRTTCPPVIVRRAPSMARRRRPRFSEPPRGSGTSSVPAGCFALAAPTRETPAIRTTRRRDQTPGHDIGHGRVLRARSTAPSPSAVQAGAGPAEAVAWFVSNAASFVVGQTLVVDGGFLAQ